MRESVESFLFTESCPKRLGTTPDRPDQRD